MRLKEFANKKTKGNCKIQGMINSCQILKKTSKNITSKKKTRVNSG